MVVAKIKCSKCPIICTSQTGRSHLYCNGEIECEYQRAVVEWVDTSGQEEGLNAKEDE